MTNMTAIDDLQFDPQKLRDKYAEERAKRIRGDGVSQYRRLTDKFESLADDRNVEPGFTRESVEDEVDAVLIGGGFSGLLTAVELRRAGLERIRIIEIGGDFGGTWYWNRYPGAACDVESYIYLPLLEEIDTVPTSKYARAPEIFAHTQKIASQYDLYRDALFQTRVTGADWDDVTEKWTVRTDRGDVITTRYLISSASPLGVPKLPGIPGLETFEGHMFHTSRWDYDYTGGDNAGNLTGLADKRVAIIGTGATAVQVVPHLGADAKELFVVQRTPSSIHVRGNRPTDVEWFKSQPKGWQRERMANFTSVFTGGQEEVDLVSDAWTETFFDASGSDLTDTFGPFQISNFLKMEDARARVDSVVKDKKTAEALKPWYNFFCKRPCFHDEYLETFNRPNVHLVDTDGRGVDRIDDTGFWVDGTHYEVDVIIFATGFELGTGTGAGNRGGYTIRGRFGETLDEHWADGFRSLHGLATAGFPNHFYVGGLEQGARSANFVHSISEQAHHLGFIFREASEKGTKTIEVTQEAEDAWVNEIISLLAQNSEAASQFAFLEECTPGYYNNEGTPSRLAIQDGPYGAGPMAFLAVLEEWRNAGDFAGLAITDPPAEG